MSVGEVWEGEGEMDAELEALAVAEETARLTWLQIKVFLTLTSSQPRFCPPGCVIGPDHGSCDPCALSREGSMSRRRSNRRLTRNPASTCEPK